MKPTDLCEVKPCFPESGTPAPPSKGRRGSVRATLLTGGAAMLMLGAGIVSLTWDTAVEDQPGQTTFYNDILDGSLEGQPVAVTDLNGDGFPDVVLCPFFSDSGPDRSRQFAGQVNVFLGNGGIGGVRAIATEPAAGALKIYGPGFNADFGARVAAGDVDGDGIGDLLVGADERRNFINGVLVNPGKGRAYLIRGRAGISGAIDLASPPENVTTILGVDDGDYTGTWVSLADVDGDGRLDLLISVPGGDGPANAGPTDVGEAVVVFNSRSGFPPVINLASPPKGVSVTRIFGIDAGDGFGGTIVGADLNGDGKADLAIGSRDGAFVTVGTDGPNNSRPGGGEVQVLRGGRLPASINLAAGLPRGTTTLYGAEAGGSFGEELITHTIITGNLPTLGIGALYSAQAFGEAWLVPASLAVSGRVIDMASPPAGVVHIIGPEFFSLAGDTLAAGDIDGDGFGDLLVGSPFAKTVRNGSGDGRVDVIYGQALWPALINLAQPALGYRRAIIGAADKGDMLAYSMTAADLDLDGRDDAVPNAMGSDGVRNRVRDSGGAYVISGAALSARVP